ncbi:hypothetical protein TRAPUB_1090 [Trametes pubescens]|uniref:Uncharacterized protein n=1 Tax=Trametes pubescens TaxID=154538 RepID=A0A1M2VKA1_TRAPU|nr:hypothetical protein TRAPUB_1090 [Trametes pubescens]
MATPRPLPPAKTRRSSALHYSTLAPPPPYSPSLSELALESPSPNGALPEATAPIEEWMDEKSREELSGLLLKADGIIKTRETELSYTSALVKSLYDDNVALKTKHEALLARLPAMSPSPSTPTSPRLRSPSSSLSPFPGIMFPTSSEDSLQPLPAAARLRHTRRISVTPGDLAHLSDQNAELLEKLERLESESTKADEAGKRKLRKLEQEIQTLRDELDKTHARGAELEEQAKAAVNAAQIQQRREERQAWVRSLKDKSAFGSDLSGAEIKDFAPPSELPRFAARTLSYGPAPADPSEASGDLSDASFEPPSFDEDVLEDGSANHDSYISTPPTSARDPPQMETEYAIVSQLLSKIRELEETNAQIKEQQSITEEHMRAARWDVDSINRVYDCLDVADIDIEDPEEEEQPARGSRIPSGGTIKFSSLRRSLQGDMSRLSMDDASTSFFGGISKEMQSTARKSIGGHRGAPGHKARKSIAGLFDIEPERESGHPPLRVSPRFNHATHHSIDLADTSIWSAAATDGVAPPSPSFSTLQTPLDGPQTGRTLGSELGSEFGDDWQERGFNHHLRTTSLYSLAGLNLTQSTPGSPVESPPAPPSIVFPAPPGDQQEQYIAGPSTPPRSQALQLTIEPPTPTPERLRSPGATRQIRLSQTMRARTNRWVEGRFQQESLRDNVLRRRQSTSRQASTSTAKGKARAASGSDAPATLDDTFDDAVAQIRRVRSRASLAALGFSAPLALPDARETGEDAPHEEAERSVELRRLSQEEAAAVADPARREGFVGFVLEAWLWLQFAIVVMLFLWAMAKRGPKVVLEAERRATQRGGAGLQ